MLVPIRKQQSLTRFVATLQPTERARQAASSLKQQKQALDIARTSKGLQRRLWLAKWHEERTVWAHLVGVAS